MTRVAPLLDLIAEKNPAAFPFCKALITWSARVDDVADEPASVSPGDLSWSGFRMAGCLATDPWAQQRTAILLSQMMLAHTYWVASLRMKHDAAYHVFKDKIVDILLYAIGEVVTIDELVTILLDYQHGTFAKE